LIESARYGFVEAGLASQVPVARAKVPVPPMTRSTARVRVASIFPRQVSVPPGSVAVTRIVLAVGESKISRNLSLPTRAPTRLPN
jgi:hypothetical protein